MFDQGFASRFPMIARHLSVSLEQLQVGWMTIMVGLSPWAFGCVDPLFESYLAYAVVVLLALWCARLVWEPDALQLTVRRAGWIALAMGCWLACVAIPLLPLPDGLSKRLSPAVELWVQRAQPSQREVLKVGGDEGEEEGERRGASSHVGNDDAPIPLPNTVFLGGVSFAPKENGKNSLDSNRLNLKPGGLSLNPAGNWQFLLRLSALCLIFLSCVSLDRPEEALRQLAWAAAVFGSLLALVAMLQNLTPGSPQMYWFFDTKGTMYGPFLNKNHYPFFANLAMGLTLGLLLDRRTLQGSSWLSMFHDTPALWLSAGLALQLSSLSMCLSRGGIAAAVVAITLVSLIRLQKGTSSKSAFAGVLVGAGAVGLMTWAGFDLLESRLVSLSESETYREDGRWYLWRVATEVASQFPLFGAGSETFRHWETIIQFEGPWSSDVSFAHRADNEYLDVLCEQGVLAALALVSFNLLLMLACWRRIKSNSLIAGGVVSLLSVMLHSLVDFGLRIPASAVFATIVAGMCYAVCRPARPAAMLERRGHASRHLKGVANPDKGKFGSMASPMDPPTAPSKANGGELTAWLSLLVVAGVLAFMAVFASEKGRYARADQHLVQAYQAVAEDDPQRILLHLQAMIAATPDNVLAHIEVARVALLVARQNPLTPEAHKWLDLAIVHCVQARDVCPLTWESQFWIAEHVRYLAGKQTALEYLQRGHMLHPSNATIAYLLGLELSRSAAADQTLQQAEYQAWADALRKSTQYLHPILSHYFQPLADASLAESLANELLQHVLPENPRTLMEASGIVASFGHPGVESLFLNKAAEVAAKVIERELPGMKSSEKAATYGLAADIQLKLGQPEQAVEFYRLAIPFAKQQANWRLRIVETLVELKDFDAAARELRLLELLEPDSSQVKMLKNEISGQKQGGK
jgi:hypothetical protein